MRVAVRTVQVCLFCGKPFESRMVPFAMPSRSHGNTQFWLHIRCVEAAFAAARSPIDADDMAIEVAVQPEGRGWADIPDGELPGE